MTPRAEPIALLRDCIATTVPYGERVMLPEGSEVQIVQQLGGSVTIRNEYRSLLRINGADFDALGLDPADQEAEQAASGTFSIDQVTDALQGVYDPEIPISIVELGLVYRCEEIARPDGGRRIEIDMSMTAPGCGMGEVLREDATRAVQAVPGVDEVEVTLVWDPPWSMERISEATKLELGLL